MFRIMIVRRKYLEIFFETAYFLSKYVLITVEKIIFYKTSTFFNPIFHFYIMHCSIACNNIFNKSYYDYLQQL